MPRSNAWPALTLCFALISCSSTPSPAPAPLSAPNVFTVQPSAESALLTQTQRSALGFQYGPPDGAIGVLLNGGTYTFFMSAASSSACAGTPSVQGT